MSVSVSAIAAVHSDRMRMISLSGSSRGPRNSHRTGARSSMNVALGLYAMPASGQPLATGISREMSCRVLPFSADEADPMAADSPPEPSTAYVTDPVSLTRKDVEYGAA